MKPNAPDKQRQRPDLVLLDRDGVINHDSDDYIKTPSEWTPIDGSIDAISQLQRKGIVVAVCTNQSGLARGLIKRRDLLSMHNLCNQKILESGGRPIRFFFCPHLPSDECECRKPQPDLIRFAMSEYGLTNNRTVFVGDSISDLKAALANQVEFALVSTGNGKHTRNKLGPEESNTVQYHSNLAGYVESLKL